MVTQKRKLSANDQAREDGIKQVRSYGMFTYLDQALSLRSDAQNQWVNPSGWLTLHTHGTISYNAKRTASAQEWLRVLAQAYVAFGFGLVQRREPQALWDLAVLITAEHFCAGLKIGALPESMDYLMPPSPREGAEQLFRQFVSLEAPGDFANMRDVLVGIKGTSGQNDYIQSSNGQPDQYRFRTIKMPEDWRNLFAKGIARSAEEALLAASTAHAKNMAKANTPAQTAKQYLIDHYPLLGALAASFEVVDDLNLCRLYNIDVAAIHVSARKIWMNPLVCQKLNECVFIFAHELLHAGLNHSTRRRGRDPLLWNVACDFVINGWLIAMKVGTPPSLGLLHDPKYENTSAEDIYDELAIDMRRARKLMTMRGAGATDILDDELERSGADSIFVNAEEYCRRALAQGLEYVMKSGRGLIPAGLVEEIRSLAQPPIPWDVRLAYWFDEHFPPPEPRRSYARPSRRQSATPDIPRPSQIKPNEDERSSRVFAVVLDTSGSMDLNLLGKAIGAIASYSLARDVYAVRLICCDAMAYDLGWVEPEQLQYRFTVKGRGGTVLQPGVDVIGNLMSRGDFPKIGPVLILTDGGCESDLSVAHEHAFLLPAGRSLPFRARGEVFFVE